MQRPRSVSFEAEAAGLRVIDVEYPPRTDFETHTHEEPYAVLVVRGSYVEWLPKRRTVHRGSDHLWPAGSRHAVRTGAEPVRILHLADPTDRDGPVDHPLRLGIMWQIASCLDSGHAVEDDDAGRLHLESLVGELVESDREAWGDSTVLEGEGNLDVVRARLRDGYRDQPSLTELASMIGRHPSHLARAFRARWGMTAGEYLRRVRVAEAIRMLRETDAPLSSVAFSAGFADQSHLGRWTRRYVGMTPGELRESADRSRFDP